MSACARVAEIYEEGTVAPADPAKVAELKRKACDGGVTRACAWANDGANVKVNVGVTVNGVPARTAKPAKRKLARPAGDTDSPGW